MRNNILKVLTCVALGASMTSCGNDFLETKNYKGVDVDNGLTDANSVANAVNGIYYWLHNYRFAGNYATTIGDVPTDVSYWNTETNHFNDIYCYTVTDDNSYLKAIWNYGYKVVDNSARAIKAAKSLYQTATDDDKKTLGKAMAEAYALRGYANLVMVNIFAHQIKVDGTDYSGQPGLVISDEPIEALAQVSRSTVGETYDKIISDLKNAISNFETSGDNTERVYFTKAAVEGLLARTYLYMENYDEAYNYAQKALQDASGVATLATTADSYKNLYNTLGSNSESLFYLAIDSKDNFSANSCGTLYSTYGYLPTPKLQALYGTNDCRTSVQSYNNKNGVMYFKGGKFSDFQSGNSAYGTNYLINAPEMYLIEAEAKLRGSSDLNAAKAALLVVAKRNSDIKSAEDLPSTKDALFSFLKDERARELFQEGHRLWDLRRWNEKASVYAYGYPEVKFTYTNYEISKLVYPIPVDEINAGFGVTQNENWSSTFPK